MIMKYKGYIGKIIYEDSLKVFQGRIINIHKDILTFEATTAEGLERSIADTVEDYFNWCKEDGIEPEKPFSGKFNIRISPELHREIVEIATENEVSLNKFVENALQHEVEIIRH